MGVRFEHLIRKESGSMIQDLSSILDCVPKANIKETSRRKEDTA
jgi:hypothetical protein